MVFQFLRRGVAAEVPEVKASATGPVVAHLSAGRVAWSPRDTATLTRTGFAGNPVGFRAVKLIAEAAAALPLVLQDRQRRYDEHPVMSLVRRPNGAQGRAELFEALYGQLLLSGDGYLEAVMTDMAVPLELHVLRSDRMRLVPGADGWPVAYEYAVGGRKHRFDVTGEVSPICHIKSFHPQDDHYGLSPMQAAAAALDVHNAASRWSKGLLDNAARPSGAIIYQSKDGSGGTMSWEQYERLVSEMETHHQGARNAGRPMLLEGGLDWKPMGFSPPTWSSRRPRRRLRARSRWPLACRLCFWAFRERRPLPITRRLYRAFYRLTVLPLGHTGGGIGLRLAFGLCGRGAGVEA